jgi:hypothetical protein
MIECQIKNESRRKILDPLDNYSSKTMRNEYERATLGLLSEGDYFWMGARGKWDSQKSSLRIAAERMI